MKTSYNFGNDLYSFAEKISTLIVMIDLICYDKKQRRRLKNMKKLFEFYAANTRINTNCLC